jgi:hypothetical protein
MFRTKTYGARVASTEAPDNIDNHRYRNYLDPVSILEKGGWIVNEIHHKAISCNSFDNVKTHRVSRQGYQHQTEFVDLEKQYNNNGFCSI